MTESKAAQAKRELAEDRAEAKAEQKAEQKREDAAEAKAQAKPTPVPTSPKPVPKPEPQPEPVAPVDPDAKPAEPTWSGKDADFPAWVQADMRYKENK